MTEDFEDVIVQALSEPDFADDLRALHHKHVVLDANARHFIAKQVLAALGIELVGVATEAGITSGGDFITTSASNASPGDVPLYRLRPKPTGRRPYAHQQ